MNQEDLGGVKRHRFEMKETKAHTPRLVVESGRLPVPVNTRPRSPTHVLSPLLCHDDRVALL